jgi:hypothetical protein
MTENDRNFPITGELRCLTISYRKRFWLGNIFSQVQALANLPGQPLKKEVGLTKMGAQRQKAAALLKP